MNQYYSIENTPLKFHKFFHYVTAPLGTILTLINLFTTIAEVQSSFFFWGYGLDIAYFIAHITCLVLCFVGFFQWRSYAWYSVNALLGINILYHLIVIFVYAVYLPEELASAIGGLIGYGVFAVLTGIYYKKRRPLFFPEMQPTETFPGEY